MSVPGQGKICWADSGEGATHESRDGGRRGFWGRPTRTGDSRRAGAKQQQQQRQQVLLVLVGNQWADVGLGRR